MKDSLKVVWEVLIFPYRLFGGTNCNSLSHAGLYQTAFLKIEILRACARFHVSCTNPCRALNGQQYRILGGVCTPHFGEVVIGEIVIFMQHCVSRKCERGWRFCHNPTFLPYGCWFLTCPKTDDCDWPHSIILRSTGKFTCRVDSVLGASLDLLFIFPNQQQTTLSIEPCLYHYGHQGAHQPPRRCAWYRFQVAFSCLIETVS